MPAATDSPRRRALRNRDLRPLPQTGPVWWGDPMLLVGRLRVGVIGVVLALLVTLLSAAVDTTPKVGVHVVSSPRPDMVSGGDVLLRVTVPPGLDPERVTVTVNGLDQTSAFDRAGAQRIMLGLVAGLRIGFNEVRVTAGPATPPTVLTVRNHPTGGPMFAGAQQYPYSCTTHLFTTAAGNRLPRAEGLACHVATRVEYVYRGTDGEFRELADPRRLPSDVSRTRLDGLSVPFVVRVETGVINRGVYEFAVLHDPRHGEPTVHATATGWNRRLVYTFGGGCPGGWYQQGTRTGGVLDASLLGRGYAIASSTLNRFANNCDPVRAAETMAMTKEHVVETLGEPVDTIGTGVSGGSYQLFMIGDNYPGLLDGIVAGQVFPEVAVATLQTLVDARLLHNYVTSYGRDWTDDQLTAVTGFGRAATLQHLAMTSSRLDPMQNCPDVLPRKARYDPVDNPRGARCDVLSHQDNLWGIADVTSGAPYRALDNVGVQYGLGALNTGMISVADFLDLNERIGGFDRDAMATPQRIRADPQALAVAYGTGQLISGGGGLRNLPIIDFRNYTDHEAGGDLHLRFHSFTLQQRLVQANGHADNLVSWVSDADNGPSSIAGSAAVIRMAEWLTAIDQVRREGDVSGAPAVVAARPAGLVDGCWIAGRFVTERHVDGHVGSRCAKQYPAYASPRQVAGAGVVNNQLACTRRPVDRRDYAADFTDQQWDRLLRVFADGVCDWSVPGIGQATPHRVWSAF
ncbi:DUF6351 family protein [Microlunatus sp. Y2014]|uniref:DUF6351 family protein n=1 Tax=Microlunatus sp. Y2014 TaxID=3418488 RepID=UPI003DA6DF85